MQQLRRLVLALGLPFLIASTSACGDDDDSSSGGGSGTGATGAGGQGGGGAAGGGGASGGAGGSPTGYQEIVCPEPLTPAPGVTCEVDSVGSAGLMLRGTVLAPETLYRGGQVLINSAGTIACVGCECGDWPGADSASVVTCESGVISPGLINPHDHIGFANNAPADHGNERYEHRHDWRKGKNGHTKISVQSGASAEVVQFAELRFVMSGTTSGATAGGRTGLMRNVDNGGLLEGLPINAADSDTFPLDDSDGTQQQSGCDYGNSPTTASDIADEDSYLPHISEGIGLDAQNEFVCTSQGNQDLIAPQTAVIHGIGLRPEDIAMMRADRAGVVWSPRSNVDLYGNTASVTLLDRLGIPISLGTDWVRSGSMHMLRELACADSLNRDYFGGHFDDVALWRMVTTNAAFATGIEHAAGLLKRGFLADIAVFDGSVATDHRAVIEADPENVALVLRGGEVLYGDDALVASAAIGGQACETLDVCGQPKRACVAQDLGGGATLASIRAAGEAFYPLFNCGDPPNEPSCVPWRQEYAAGITATDSDGDGIDDASDLCPSVFDPIRPMDGNQQANADGDAAGDACDLCPLDGADACVPPDANDLDEDGAPNGSDNCPNLANPDQADADEDGHGDACDDCADALNPGPTPCPAPGFGIPDLRNPAAPDYPGVGAVVSISGVYVTAVRPPSGGSNGFYVQDTSLAPYSGIFVFTQTTTPSVQVGNRVTVSGTLEEFFDFTELSAPIVTIEDPGTALPFAPIAIANPADIATGGSMAESHESMLVSVGAVTILTQNANAPQDFDELIVTGGLWVGDELFEAIDNTCPVGTNFSSLTGILGYSFNNTKLAPRDANDVGVTGCQPF